MKGVYFIASVLVAVALGLLNYILIWRILYRALYGVFPSTAFDYILLPVSGFVLVGFVTFLYQSRPSVALIIELNIVMACTFVFMLMRNMGPFTSLEDYIFSLFMVLIRFAILAIPTFVGRWLWPRILAKRINVAAKK